MIVVGKRLAWLAPILGLAGCEAVVLSPSGDVAARQAALLVQSTLLMLVIIVPVMVLTVWFAWRYRHQPHPQLSPRLEPFTKLELVIWAIPLLIIICLGALTWVGTHLLDPYRPLDRIGEDRPAGDRQPLQVQVVAMDWKWLFIYPEQGVASVNQMAAPVDRPMQFSLTSTSVMNAFYVTGLLRMSQAGGAFLRANDPAGGRWYSRDTAAIAATLGLPRIAPYFIDAAHAGEAQPIGGLTVVSFRNTHLVYALTWFAMAGGLAVLTARALRR